MKLSMLKRYFHLVAQDWVTILLGFFLPIIAILIWKKVKKNKTILSFTPSLNTIVPLVILIASMGIGAKLALDKTSLFDDAYISLRYSENLVNGNGLVFNVAENVEGYTNFLWTLLLALLIKVTQIEPSLIAIGLAFCAFLINLVIVYRIGLVLSAEAKVQIYIPVAVMLMGVQSTITDYGTSGLETMAASALVNLGALSLISRTNAVGSFFSGAALILATMMRPDHSLFYIAAGATILIRNMSPMLHARRDGIRAIWKMGLRDLAAFAAPFTGYICYLIWKLSYYGNILPNTYFAKSVNLTYFSQGLTYASSFCLGSHFWIVALFFLIWLATPSRRGTAMRSMKLFSGISIIVYNYYIIKIGGDFMYGRFYVTLIPLALLGVENWLYTGTLKANPARTRDRSLLATVLIAAFLFGTAGGVTIIGPGIWRWGITNESLVYRVESFSPVVIRHFSFRLAHFMKKVMYDRGVRPVISTHGIGMIAYYSELETIDQMGITDAFVAHLPLKRRGLTGHEKHAPLWYLRKRNVILGRLKMPKRYNELTRVNFGKGMDKGWSIVTYDRFWIYKLRASCPEIKFRDFEIYLDRYIQRIGTKKMMTVYQDFVWFKGYYFDHNDDPKRYQAFTHYLMQDVWNWPDYFNTNSEAYRTTSTSG